MGQPKFNRRKYDTPNHPWQGERIKAEHELRRKFGLKNKTEIWKAQTRLRDIRGQARGLVSRTRNPDDEQAATEAKVLLQRLHRQGYVAAEATLNEVLGLDVERILNRRLQSQVFLKGMARTPQQARQFVSHGLIQIGERRVTVPSYVVRREEEELIQFKPTASVADADHPVRPHAPGVDAVAEVAARRVETPAVVAASEPEAAAEATAPDASTAEVATETAPDASTAEGADETAPDASTPEVADEPTEDES